MDVVLTGQKSKSNIKELSETTSIKFLLEELNDAGLDIENLVNDWHFIKSALNEYNKIKTPFEPEARTIGAVSEAILLLSKLQKQVS